MPAMDNALISGASAYGTTRFGQVPNLTLGGQLGIGPNIPKIDLVTPLVLNPTVFIVLELPTMWDAFPERKAMMKALVEQHAKTISGVDFGYQLNTGESAVGHDTQNLSVPTNTTRTSISPSFTWMDLYGALAWNLIRAWIFDIQHPDTQASLMSAQLETDNIPAYLMSAFSMSMIGIQYDPTMVPDRIIDAAFYTCMFPTETTEFGFERQVGQAQTKERTIPFKGIVQHNENTRELGKVVAQNLAIHKINYQLAPTSAGVSADLSDVGIGKEVRDAMRDFKLVSA